MKTPTKPLDGMLVLDFSQFLSGPSAALRLADLGARVIKVERPDGGDICRYLYISNMEVDGDSTLFHSINRNKESFSANLKSPEDLELVHRLIAKADVMIQNFRPGVMARLGLDYTRVQQINPSIIYGEITGYGSIGPWHDKPGQDLLMQSRSGLVWLNGDWDQPPLPFGLAVADMAAGAHLVQGILACLVKKGMTGKGSHVEVSLFESIMDFQFEVLTTYLNDGKRKPESSKVHNAHAYIGAPYGIYQTQNGYLALAMTPINVLADVLQYDALRKYMDPQEWLEKRDEIKRHLADHLMKRTTEEWLFALEPAGIWCSDVLTWDALLQHEGFKALDMLQTVTRNNGAALMTTRCPIRIDGQIYTSAKASPRIGEDNGMIMEDILGD